MQPWASPAQWTPFSVSACPLAPAWLAKQPDSFTHYSERALEWQAQSQCLPCGAPDTHNICQHFLSFSCLCKPSPPSLPPPLPPRFFPPFGLMHSSPDCRHLVNPFRSYQLCSSAHKPITLEEQF